jgi:hypothetical protein
MSRRPTTVTQTEIKRAVKGVVDAGVEVARVEVEKDGRIVVIAGKPSTSEILEPSEIVL